MSKLLAITAGLGLGACVPGAFGPSPAELKAQQRAAFLAEQPPTPAPHPLGGEALVQVIRRHQGDGCDRPIEDAVNYVVVNGASICMRTIHIEFLREGDVPDWPMETGQRFFVVTEAGASGDIVLTKSELETPVAACEDLDAEDWRDAHLTVWRGEYVGCTANDDLVTADTGMLALRLRLTADLPDGTETIRWVFDR